MKDCKTSVFKNALDKWLSTILDEFISKYFKNDSGYSIFFKQQILEILRFLNNKDNNLCVIFHNFF